MANYVLKVTNGQENTAGTKAKIDITTSLEKKGYDSVDLKIKDSKIWKLFFLKKEVVNSMKKLTKGDVFVIQYPMYSRMALKLLLDKCFEKGIKTICVIHDLESLRLYKNDKTKIDEELSTLRKSDSIISHNRFMSNWLRKNGITNNVIDLEIFDYLNDFERVEVSKDKNLVFAGNLEKSTFLEKWNINKKVTVYGVNPSNKYPNNILYKGVKNPDELPKYLSGSFGLVWDGDALETNNGLYGEYTKYNNPHKVSLYLSCGLPVIVWKKAAIASFVEENNLGISISSLNELKNVFFDLTEDKYLNMQENATNISKKIRHGFFIKKAVDSAISKIE
jgi:hypothetical protein